MKKLIIASFLFLSLSAFSQMNDTNESPKEFVEKFFKAFHEQDTVKLKSYAYEGAKLESVIKEENGDVKLMTSDYPGFLKNIASIPEDATFEERLHEYRVEENGDLATVTTPYTLYFNGKLYHCGVNSFQLVKFGEEWKLVYLIDTRIKEGCE